MKKIFSITMLLMFSLTIYAQKDVTQFLGIPVDGSKSEMIRKIKEKGYKSKPYDNDILTGEFNGTPVNILIGTNNNKVCRIMVCDANDVNERDIQIRFNKLYAQFANNSKYESFQNSTIPDTENISYEITVNKKRYEAVFYQMPTDTIAFAEKIKSFIYSKYSKEQLLNPTEEFSAEITKLSQEYAFELLSKKSVWFMISDNLGKYGITMYYDNEYNRANGEDL